MSWTSFVVASFLTAVMHFVKRQMSAAAPAPVDSVEDGEEKEKSAKSVNVTPEFVSFQRNYLAVYLLAMFVDWLKGPYVYVLYESYGIAKKDIAVLFMGGFGASMLAGTVAGAAADTLGRRKMVLVFAASYAVAGVTKLFPSFWILMVGRILSGVATSLLFSVFEAWMVCEHTKRGFSDALLSDTFSKATTGNGIVAVVAGLVASAIASQYGFVAPFVLALLPLGILAAIVVSTWSENYGNASLEVSASLSNGISTLRANPGILFLGMAQSLFEGGMYTFVFMWTPGLATKENHDSLPYGLIFAVYMVCIMLGSSVFSISLLPNKPSFLPNLSVQSLPLYIHSLAAATMLGTAYLFHNKTLVYLMFCSFEVACGIFFPTYGTLRSLHIPESSRSTIMNIFRIPLNAVVLIVLIGADSMGTSQVFFICSIMHAAAGVCYVIASSFFTPQTTSTSK